VTQAGVAGSSTGQRCWVCASESTTRWKPRNFDGELSPEHFRITDSTYGATLALRLCRDCGFIFADDPELPSLLEHYERLEDRGYEQTQDTRALQMAWLLARIGKVRPNARTLLDIGAGTGLLVAQASRLGYDAIGIEPSHSLVEAALRDHGVKLLQGTFPHSQLGARTFDVITLIDVIEHVNAPVDLLRACASAQTANGIVVVVTPDVGSVAARLLGKRWWHFRIAHVGYFSARSLEAAARNAGLQPLQRFRAKWFFRAQYLAERLARYLPLGGINRMANRPGLLQRIYQQVVPVNLHDSTVIILAKTAL
jgi:2-polyprenyl-3-methyl-5-hydroxy-6-metoxy-1,4-benzoquinol methylase